MDDQNIRDTIRSNNENFMQIYSRGDAPGMAELYTSDGQVLPPNADAKKGKKAIQAFWQALMDMGVKKIILETGEVEQHGDIATEVSKAKLLAEGDQVLDDLKYIVVWKKLNGNWKMHLDIFNSSRPAS